MMKMPFDLPLKKKYFARPFKKLTKPLSSILSMIPQLESRGNRRLKMTFEYQLNALIFFKSFDQLQEDHKHYSSVARTRGW